MKKYKSEAFEAIHKSMSDLHNVGGISEERMREYDKMCLVKHSARGPRGSASQRRKCAVKNVNPN